MVEKITTSPKDPREKARQRVEHQIKMELEALQNSTKKEYDEGKLLELLKDYLHILKEKSREELTEKNTAAWIIAVQFALLTIDLYSDESPLSRNDEIVFYLYLFSTLDGILGDKTKARIEKFQKKYGLKVDGLPGKETIKRLLDEIEKIEQIMNTLDTLEQQKTLTLKDAQYLVKHSKGSLDLPLLTSISKEVAAELAKYKGDLRLDGLTSISKEVAAELAKCKGNLSLGGLTSISKEAAIELAKFQGKSLFVPGLRHISKEIRDILDKNPKIYCVSG